MNVSTHVSSNKLFAGNIYVNLINVEQHNRAAEKIIVKITNMADQITTVLEWAIEELK